jgi:hypothetical protein
MPTTTVTTTVTTAANKFRRIGQGFCGSVWAPEIADSSDSDYHCVIKREDGGPDRSISNDFNMHRRILDTCTMPLLVPRCYQLVKETDVDWWIARADRFPAVISHARLSSQSVCLPFRNASGSKSSMPSALSKLSNVVAPSKPLTAPVPRRYRSLSRTIHRTKTASYARI